MTARSSIKDNARCGRSGYRPTSGGNHHSARISGDRRRTNFSLCGWVRTQNAVNAGSRPSFSPARERRSGTFEAGAPLSGTRQMDLDLGAISRFPRALRSSTFTRTWIGRGWANPIWYDELGWWIGEWQTAGRRSTFPIRTLFVQVRCSSAATSVRVFWRSAQPMNHRFRSGEIRSRETTICAGDQVGGAESLIRTQPSISSTSNRSGPPGVYDVPAAGWATLVDGLRPAESTGWPGRRRSPAPVCISCRLEEG